MIVVRGLKKSVLSLLRATGVTGIVMSSPWRRNRLVVLCYHGVSIGDEHQWRPEFYLCREHFRSRMELLRQRQCHVLPLREALQRLAAGTLPPRAVSITFDDGFHDYAAVAWPVLRELSFPATVYLTTYYSDHHRWPVFDLMLSYALWKSTSPRCELPGILPEPIHLDAGGRQRAFDTVGNYCLNSRLSGAEKHNLMKDLCRSIGFDLQDAVDRGLLCLMSPAEVAEVAEGGTDIEFHTHRHRIFATEERFAGDLNDNRDRILRMTGREPEHFCYPGNFRPAALSGWLRAAGVESAVTCDSGIASRATDPYALPRILDITSVTEVEFDAWICGVAALFPTRKYAPSIAPLQQNEFPEMLAGAD